MCSRSGYRDKSGLIEKKGTKKERGEITTTSSRYDYYVSGTCSNDAPFLSETPIFLESVIQSTT